MIKCYTHAHQFLQKDVYSAGKQFLVSSSKIMTGGMYFIVVLGLGVFNFISQALVFFSVLYFLITSKSDGVMYQVLDMVPVSDQTRQRCATVLDHAVSSVLLTTTKTMFYQVLCFIPTFHSQTTWLHDIFSCQISWLLCFFSEFSLRNLETKVLCTLGSCFHLLFKYGDTFSLVQAMRVSFSKTFEGGCKRVRTVREGIRASAMLIEKTQKTLWGCPGLTYVPPVSVLSNPFSIHVNTYCTCARPDSALSQGNGIIASSCTACSPATLFGSCYNCWHICLLHALWCAENPRDNLQA